MPDFDKLLERLKAKREAEISESAPKTAMEQYEQMVNPKPKQFGEDDNLDLSASYYDPNDKEAHNRAVDQGIQETFRPQRAYDAYERERADTEFSPTSFTDSFLLKSQRSIGAGVGDLIEGWGDIAQIVGSAAPGINMYDGNVVSRWLQDQGQDIQEENKQFISEEMKNPEWSLKTLANPDFWSIHMAGAIPQLVEIVTTFGEAALLKKGAQAGMKMAFKEVLENVAENKAKRLAGEAVEEGLEKSLLGRLKTTTAKGFRGGEAINEVAGTGSGLLGKMMTDRGTLTKGFGNLIEGVGGGLITNVKTSMLNAAEVYNTYKDIPQLDENGQVMLDESGQPVPAFTKEELGKLAASTFANNSEYLAADILSWGLSFGKGGDLLKGLGKKSVSAIGGKLAGKVENQLLKKVSALATESISPVLKKIANNGAVKLGTKMIPEALEESIQESWEEWSKIKAYADVHGSLDGYQGRLSQNYNTESGMIAGIFDGGFYDFYTSKDSEAIRTIAAGAGGLMAGGFNIRSVINKQSDAAYKLGNRAANLEQNWTGNKEGKQWQDYHIRATMGELLYEGAGPQFEDFTNSLYQEGKITEEEVQKYGAIYDKGALQLEGIKDLNINGKKAYMTAFMEEDHLQGKVDEAVQIFGKNVDVLKATISDNEELAKAINKEKKVLDKKIVPLANMIAKTKENQKNLIIGKKSNPIAYDIELDPNGNPIYIEKEMTIAPTEEEVRVAKDSMEDFDQKLKQGLEKAKKATNSAKEYLAESFPGIAKVLGYESVGKVDATTGVNSSNTQGNSANTEPTIEQQVAGSINALKNTLKVGDILSVNGVDQTVSNVVQDVNSTSFDYEEEVGPTMVEDKEKGFVVTSADLKTEESFTDKTQAKTRLAELEKQPKFKATRTVVLKDGKAVNKLSDKEVLVKSKKANVESIIDPKAVAGAIALGEELTPEQKTYYKQNKKDIDDQVEEIQDSLQFTEEEFNALSDEDKEVFKAFQKVDKKKKTKTLAEDDKATGLEEEIDIILDENNKPDEFSDARSKKEDDDKRESFLSKESIMSKSAGVLARSKNILRKFKHGANRFYEENIDTASDDLLALTQSIAMTNAIRKIFPDSNTNVYRVVDMQRTVGNKNLGYLLAGQIYINKNSWEQQPVFMHEMSHIYYALTKNDPATQAFLKYALKNKELVAKITRDYDDQIQYVNTANGLKVTKADLFVNDKGQSTYDKYSDERKDAWLSDMVKKGKLQEVPLEEQDIITDEVFAASLEGPMSDKYSRLFTDKNQDHSEIKRQFYAKNWWGKLKEKAEGKEAFEAREEFAMSLPENEREIYGKSLEEILEAFNTETKGVDMSEYARASRSAKEDRKISRELDSIDDKIKQQEKTVVGTSTYDRLMLEDYNDQDSENRMEFDDFFETDRLQYINKMSGIIKTFAQFFNKAQTIKARSKNASWKDVGYLDSKLLKYKLTQLAKTSHNSADFIRRLEESNVSELAKFNAFLDAKRSSDKYVLMQSLHWLAKNQSDVTSAKTFVSNSGQITIQTNLSNKEKTLVENIGDNAFKSFRNADQSYYDLRDSATNIYNKNYTKNDLKNVLDFFSAPGINTNELIRNNRININGKSYPLDATIVSFVKSQNGLFNGLENNTPIFNIKGKDGKYKPGIRTFVQSVVNENRKYTSDFNVLNAEGNAVPVKIIDNFLTRNLKKLKDDVLIMDKKDFINKYSHKSNDLTKGKYANGLLNFIYDKVASGGNIDLVQYDGIQNSENNKNAVLKNSDSADHRLNEFILYTKSNNANSYLMDVGRLSDSSRAYLMEVPRVKTEDVFGIENGKMVFTKKELLNNTYNTYKELGLDMTFKEYKQALENSIQDQVKFIKENRNSLIKDNHFKQMFTGANGVVGQDLTKEAKMAIANFEINQIMNGVNFNEVYFPSFLFKNTNNENEAVKRAKSASSPMFSFPSVAMEAIYVDDLKLDDFDITDAGFYILEEDAKRIENAGGKIMPLGNGYKLIHTGVEKFNKNWEGQNLYNKGFATVLNDAEVLKNPALKGAYELLKSRKAKWEAINGKADQNLLGGIPTYMNMIVPYSANKNKANMPAHYDKQVMSYDALNDMAAKGDFTQANEILDKSYYYDNDGNFDGLDGSNFGVQQVMDIDKEQANMGVQFLKSLSANASVNGNMNQVEEILNDIKNLSNKQIEDGYNIILSGNNADVREFFKSLIDKNAIDQVQADLIYKDFMSLSTPAVRDIVKNTFANYIKRNGLKLSTPGNILREKPSTFSKGVPNPKFNPNEPVSASNQPRLVYKTNSDMMSTSGNSDLNFYNKNVDGTYSKGEVVIPKEMVSGYTTSKTNTLRKREYFTLDDVNVRSLEDALSKAKNSASKNRVGWGVVFDKNNNRIGYYTEGDSVMATRIPSHGPQTTGFFEVVDFSDEKGNNIQLPNKFKEIIGSDNDGDQIFVQHKGRYTKEWNAIFDKIEAHYLTENTQKEVMEPISFKDDAESAIEKIESLYGKQDDKIVLPFSSKGKQIAFEDTLISKSNVGIAANLHSTLRLFSNYEVGLKKEITVDNQSVSKFSDSKEKSLTIASAKLLNIILDNSKYGYANKLGINKNTIHMAMLLTNLGYDLDKVGLILNHPIVKKYAQGKETNSSVFKIEENLKIFDVIKKEFGIKGKNDGINIDTKNPDASNHSIYNLLLLSNNIVDNELNAVEKVLSLHNTMTVNAFEIDSLISEFNDVVNNVENQNLVFPGKFKNSPLVQNYMTVLQKNKAIQSRIDPTVSENLSAIYNEILENSDKTFSKNDHKTLQEAMNMFHTSQILGLNNSVSKEYYKSLIDNNSPKNVFTRLQNHIKALKSVIDTDKDGNSVNAMDRNLLLNKALNFSLAGNNKYISLDNSFFNDMLDSESRKQILAEFDALPADLKTDLMLHDLMTNGWKGNFSIFTLASDKAKQQVSMNSDNKFKYSPRQLKEFKNILIKNNPELLNNYENVFFMKDGKLIPNNLFELHKGLYTRMAKNIPTLFKSNGSIYRFNGFSEEDLKTIEDARQNNNQYNTILGLIAENTSGPIKIENNFNKALDYITIKNESVKNTPPTDTTTNEEVDTETELNEIEKNLSSTVPSDEGDRAKRDDNYFKYHRTMERGEFDRVMSYDKAHSEQIKKDNYDRYLKEKSIGDKLAAEYTQEKLDKMTKEELYKLYLDESKGEDGEMKGLGWKDKFAYAKVLRGVVMEIANREAIDQSKLTGKEYDAVDIGAVDKWMMSNNISSNNPALQSLVRQMEVKYKKYIAEKTKITNEINKATDELYKEKFGYSVSGKGLKNVFNKLKENLFSNKEELYKTLYGPLIEFEQITGDDGSLIQNMKYKSQERIEEDFNKGIISPAQKNFYYTTRKVSMSLEPFALNNDKKGRTDYIPHTAPENLEILSRRGLLGLMVNSKTLNEKINDVRLNAVNPMTGKMEEGVLFKQVTDWYNTFSKSEPGSKKAVEYFNLKKKAIKLQRKGINEDGTALKLSNIEIGSALGDVFLDSFSKGRSVSATDFPSLDLNKAFVDYSSSVIFSNGNEGFEGFKNMLPLIDGIMAMADRDGNPNTAAYVDKIWKQYFMQGKKQETLPNLAVLEAAGISSDKVIDYLTKSSLIYWLGYKGLLVGGGIYATGNILIGKYGNVMQQGGENFAKGEKRFWLGKSGKFNISDPLKGVREANDILKKIGYMDINVYDDVSIDQKNSLEKTFMSFALMPMTYSEKWIQGAHFLGMLSDQEWQDILDGKEFDKNRLVEMEDTIKSVHGKGYAATDQRMIQMFSWGRMMMQFSRYIPTIIYSNFGKHDIDRYGKETMGAYTALSKTVKKGISGEWTPTTFMAYRKRLSDFERAKLDSALSGAGLLSALLATNAVMESQTLDKFISDANPFNIEKLLDKVEPASFKMIGEVAN